jgi:16S rRNA (uracil1498-N3)-methyltransferase
MAQLQRLVLSKSQLQETQATLTAEQIHYLYRVLRLKVGDRFIAMDGAGQNWLAELNSDQAILIEPIQTRSELLIAVTLLLALPKNGFDEVVRQTTELGVSCIVPVISDRTLLNPSSNKLDRWRRIAQEAAEQSERQIVPTVLDPIKFTEALQIPVTQKLICAERGQSLHLLDCFVPQEVAIAIGPEGGWTDPEIENAIAQQYQPVTLGARILRAVTAPLMAVSLIAGAIERQNRET